MSGADIRFGCEMRRSVSDKVTLRHSSTANVQEAAEEMALKLWREGRVGDGDLEDIRTRWYLKPCVWMKSPGRVRGTWVGIRLDASILRLGGERGVCEGGTEGGLRGIWRPGRE